MSIITVGIDLAKNVFAVHGVDDNGKAVLVKPKVSREHLLPLIAQLSPCLIGMEACSGAHHWARQFRQYGHTVKLMAPKFVTPYRMSGKRGKNDAADATAICEAVTRPQMRFVPVKEEHQQIILSLHRTRNGFVEERTATYNRLRGLISEFGIVCPQKIANLRRALMDHLEDLPGYVNQCVGDLLAHADSLDLRIAEYDRIIAQAAREDARSKRLMTLPGIGPNTASAMLARLGGGHDFKNGRQVAAWIGLTPGQYSSGGTARLGRITKAGDKYLRSLLVMGAKAVLSGLGDKQDRFSRWARALVERRGYRELRKRGVSVRDAWTPARRRMVRGGCRRHRHWRSRYHCASSSNWDYPALRHGRNSIHRTAGYVTRTSGGVGGRGREASSYPD